MKVRCGQCGLELQVNGPGEFQCPSCGTRNVVRNQAAAPSGLQVPGAAPAGPGPAPRANDRPTRWEKCPACLFRFAIGDVERVTCPSCGVALEVTPKGIREATAGT